MILKNAVIINENFKKSRQDIEISGTRISRIGDGLDGGEILDLSGKYVLPGFIDTHIHGACGHGSGEDESALKSITDFEATQGVTSVALTTSASEFGKLLKTIDTVCEAAKTVSGSKIAGIHCEGPFLNKKYKGAMNPDYLIEPDTEKLSQMLERSHGLLKILTIAPEAEHALELIELAVKSGVTVSMGHTNATYEEANRAIAAGAAQLTHTFNAMRPLHHREPGLLGAAFTNPMVKCEMICDFVHLHPAVIQMIYALKGADKINIVSDSGQAAGLNISEFVVEGVVRYIKDGKVCLADGTIAASAKTVLDGVQNLLKIGIPLEEVSKMASQNPAKSLKLEHETGSLAVGKLADIVVLDSDYRVSYTFVNGTCVYRGPEIVSGN